jgi:hypothetical protein
MVKRKLGRNSPAKCLSQGSDSKGGLNNEAPPVCTNARASSVHVRRPTRVQNLDEDKQAPEVNANQKVSRAHALARWSWPDLYQRRWRAGGLVGRTH